MSDGGTSTVTLNQKQNGGAWVLLGSDNFTPSSGQKVTLAASGDGTTIADALLFVGAGAQPANLLYVHADHLRSPQKMTDASQATVWDGAFDPFGKEVAITGLAAMPMRFPGQYADEETSLSYNYFRDYDPAVGRYLQSDPIGLDGGLNAFVYANANPNRFADSSGLNAQSCCDTSNSQLSDSFWYCFLTCLRDNGNPTERWLNELFEGGYGAGVAAQYGNAAGNVAAGTTGRVGVGGTPPHPTTWQHKVGSKFGPAGSRAGRLAGRLSLLVTLFDGAWDYGAAAGCAIKCNLDPKKCRGQQ